MDVMTRTKFTMHGGFSRKGDIDRLHVSRKLGGRGRLLCYRTRKTNLASYVHHSEDVYMTLVAGTYQKFEESG